MKEITKFERVMFMIISSIAVSLICWLLVDIFVTDISIWCSLVLEFIFVGGSKIHNFTIRKTLGSIRV